MNRKFAKVDSGSNIVYSPNVVTANGHVYLSPAAEHYAAADDGPWLPLVSEPPAEKVGVQYIPTERGKVEERGGTLVVVRLYDERPIPAPPVVYIVEEIIYQLIGVGKLQAVKAVVGDYWELLTMRDRIDADNEIFATAYPQFRAALVAQGVFASEAEVDALLAKCREGYVDEEVSHA